PRGGAAARIRTTRPGADRQPRRQHRRASPGRHAAASGRGHQGRRQAWSVVWVERVERGVSMTGSHPETRSAMFDLAVCAEMVFLDLPVEERLRRISDLGFQVEIWDSTAYDVDALVRTGATFSSMTGYVHGSLAC